jgi:flagellar M-ring protein FliF
MLAGGGSSTDAASQTDTQRAAEMEAAKDIEAKVQELLDSALGPNKSVVRANVRMDWTQRETTVQAYDPQSTIRSSQLITETYLTSGNEPGGIPGSATNLPQLPTTTTISGTLLTSYNRNEKVNNYEITQRQTHEIASPGTVQNVSLAVLVDGVSDPAQLQTLKAVIGPAAGIDSARGDTLAVESLAFDHTYTTQQAADLSKTQQTDLYFRIGETAAAVLALLILVFIVTRQLTKLQKASAQAWIPVIKPVSQLMFAEGTPQTTALPVQPVENIALEPPPAPVPALQEPKPVIKIPQVEIPAVSAEDEHLLNLVSKLTEDNPASIAEIIQVWLDEDER